MLSLPQAAIAAAIVPSVPAALADAWQTWPSIALVGGWLGAILWLAEWLYRHRSIDSEIGRKVVHIGTGNVIFFAWWLHIPAWVGIGAAIAAGLVALISYRVAILPSVNGVGRQSLGTLFYAISIGTAIAAFWPIEGYAYAALGIAIMAWGDGLAALVGQRFGRHRYTLGGIAKSWEGSLTMLAVSYGLTVAIAGSVWGYGWQTWAIAAAVAIAATGLEAFSKYGIDNLTVPLGSAALAFWLGTTFGAG